MEEKEDEQFPWLQGTLQCCFCRAVGQPRWELTEIIWEITWRIILMVLQYM